MPEPLIRVRLRSLRDLRTTMEFRGINSGYELAKRAGLKQGAVNHLVHGRRNTCSGKTAAAIAEALNEPTERLFVLDRSAVHDNRERLSA